MTGLHNCRDYYLQPEETSSKVSEEVSTSSILAARAARVSQKSPLNGPSRRPEAFPFVRLPYELRQQVYSYLLPCTAVQREKRHLLQAITQKRVPPTHTNLTPDLFQRMLAGPPPGPTKESIIWRRGQTSLLAVCRQFHDECAELMYGESTFVIFVTYDSITFRFRWSLPNGLSPNRTFELLELVPPKYLRLIKRLSVTVDHVDSYTGQIKYNVGGKGLTHGLKGQVAKLVKALRDASANQDKEQAEVHAAEQGVKWLDVKLLNGNDILDAEKRNMIKAGEPKTRGPSEVQTVLEPLQELKGLVSLTVKGAVTGPFIEELREATTKGPDKC